MGVLEVCKSVLRRLYLNGGDRKGSGLALIEEFSLEWVGNTCPWRMAIYFGSSCKYAVSFSTVVQVTSSHLIKAVSFRRTLYIHLFVPTYYSAIDSRRISLVKLVTLMVHYFFFIPIKS